MVYSKLITIRPGVRSGKPCIRGTRMTVSDVLEYLAGGMTEDEVLQDFPELTRDDIRAGLAFAAERERQLHWSFRASWRRLRLNGSGTGRARAETCTASSTSLCLPR